MLIVLGALAWAFAAVPDSTVWTVLKPEENRFLSPATGIISLAGAVDDNDVGTLTALIGGDCGSAVIDSSGRKAVTDGPQSPDAEAVSVALHLGDDEVPVRLLKINGAWRLDAAAGCETLLARRVSSNETKVMKSLAAGADREPNAHRTLSDPARDGYYYKLVGSSAVPDKSDGDVASRTPKRDVALIAYPASYGVSGIMTFIVDQTGKLYKKDLGPKTILAVLELRDFRADSSWQTIETLDKMLVETPISSQHPKKPTTHHRNEKVASGPS